MSLFNNPLLIIVIIIYFVYERDSFFKAIDQCFERYDQIEECVEWCEKDVVLGLGSFSESEKYTCRNKCYKFSVLPPVVEYICKFACKPIDFLFLYGNCINNGICDYYIDINSVRIKVGVKTRWLKAIVRKYAKS